MRPQIIDRLSKIFLMLPGIGQRQAARFAYWLVDADSSVIDSLKSYLDEIKTARRCSDCFRVHAGEGVCSICKDASRDGAKIAVVEKDTDLENMEKSGVYDGKYHVLGGLLSTLDRESRDRLRLKEIFSRVKNDGKIREIILALSATPEGEFSSRYIEKIIEPLAQKRRLKITRLGRGISSGAELEYLNRETIQNALENRR